MAKRPDMRSSGPRAVARVGMLTVLVLVGCAAAVGAQGTEALASIGSIPTGQIFTFLFLMLGPIKIIGPFATITQKADARLARQLALRGTMFATAAVLLAAMIGESFLERYTIPVPVLELAGGLILFLVALQAIMQQFNPPGPASAPPDPTLGMAMSPLAFPTIVTPHGIAAVIVFISLGQDLAAKLTVVGLVLAIMALNLLAMLAARWILRPFGIVLQILGAVLGIIQVALGLDIMLSALRAIWA